uniref:Uncharacterized protein n=1 Tax=Rhizophora mucronata TaxID=61149 RepID=A0A2P2J0W4_RHIMU
MNRLSRSVLKAGQLMEPSLF